MFSFVYNKKKEPSRCLDFIDQSLSSSPPTRSNTAATDDDYTTRRGFKAGTITGGLHPFPISTSNKSNQDSSIGSYAMPLGLLIVASSFALVTYAKRSQSMLKRMETNIKGRAPPKKEKAMTKEEYEKTRKRFEEDDF
ncbi:hypothetical protein TrRE_jg10011 [Triparma retinervis]|uniref:Transmembrane protein n=1 Tax=Triparma retinervis TaxID=2557542 RepID=A0A9W7EA89_9STRA|nr:hypothetical protein TrRE_jg10011 [Triparma retinervis]